MKEWNPNVLAVLLASTPKSSKWQYGSNRCKEQRQILSGAIGQKVITPVGHNSYRRESSPGTYNGDSATECGARMGGGNKHYSMYTAARKGEGGRERAASHKHLIYTNLPPSTVREKKGVGGESGPPVTKHYNIYKTLPPSTVRGKRGWGARANHPVMALRGPSSICQDPQTLICSAEMPAHQNGVIDPTTCPDQRPESSESPAGSRPSQPRGAPAHWPPRAEPVT